MCFWESEDLKPLSMTVQELKQDGWKNIAENCRLVKHLMRDGARQLKLYFASSDYAHGNANYYTTKLKNTR